MPAAPGPEVMLASASGEPVSTTLPRLVREGWYFELKADGVRAVVYRDGHGVRIFSRRGLDITHRYPDVVQVVAEMPFVGMIDGEIICYGLDGRPSFPAIHLRDAQSTPKKITTLAAQFPATFLPFDILQNEGLDVRQLPYEQRRELLRSLYPLPVSPESSDGEAMWQFVQEQQLEGLIAKRPGSPYRPGRQKAWVKLKLTRRLTAICLAMRPGSGSTTGRKNALELYLWGRVVEGEQPTLVPVGTVGSGLREVDLQAVAALLDQGRPALVEVEYLEMSPSDKLRMPVFKGLRSDVEIAACTLEQADLNNRLSSH